MVAKHATSEIEAAVTEENTRLVRGFEAKRVALHAALTTQTAAMDAAAADAYASTVAALSEREHRTLGMFAAARTNVLAAAAAQVTLAQVDASKARARLRDGGSSVAVHVRDAAGAEATRMKLAADSSARNVAASGATLRSEILAYPVGDLHREIPDLTDQEAAGVKTEVWQAKLDAAGEVLRADQQGAETLCGTAADNGATFAANASAIVQQVSDKLPELEHGINAGSLAVVALIQKMAGSQLLAIDTAEREALARIAESKTQAVNFLGAGKLAARELAGKAEATIDQLTADETTALRQLHTAGERAAEQITTHVGLPKDAALSFARGVRARFHEDTQRVLANLDRSASVVVGQLGVVTAAFGDAVHDRRDRMVADLDRAIGLANGALTVSIRELTNECSKVRTDATNTYAAAESQLVANARPGIQSARDTWRLKADEFVASARTYESHSLGKHARIRSQLPASMAQIAHEMGAYLRRSTARKVWDGIKSGLSSIASSLDTFVLAVLGLATILLVVFGTAFAGLAVAIAAIVVGAVMISAALLTSLYRRASMLLDTDWPWYGKILGIPAVIGTAVGDVLGISAIVEGVRGRELISNQVLSTESRASSVTEGIFQVLTLGVIGKVSRARGSQEAPSVEPATTLPRPTPPPSEPLRAKNTTPAETPPPQEVGLRSTDPEAAELRDQEGRLDVSHAGDARERAAPARAQEATTTNSPRELLPSERDSLEASGATEHEIGVVARMTELDPQKTRALIAEYGSELVDGLRRQPFKDFATLERILEKLRDEVRSRVHGLYEGITEAPDGWEFQTRILYKADGTRSAETWAIPPNAQSSEGAFFETAYDPKTQTLLLKRAFMRDHGENLAAPGLIPKQPGRAEMLANKGTPTIQYVTLHQMKKLGVPMGSPAGLRTVHLDNIQNISTIVHLHYLTTQMGIDESLAFRATDSMRHAETTANQSGYRLVGEPMVGRAHRDEIGKLCHYQELTNPDRIKEHDAILAKFGYTRSTVMKVGFDVDFNVEPAP